MDVNRPWFGKRVSLAFSESVSFMFTGIVQGVGEIVRTCGDDDLRTFEIALPGGLGKGLERGASVAVNGVCLTATTRQDAST